MSRERAALAGIAAPVVWLAGALAMSYDEQSFMDKLGWDVWPSGLSLGPDGWGQILVFLVFSSLYIAFAHYTRSRATWSRLARRGAWLFQAVALVTPLLAFKTDPMKHDLTWHGALHAAGYIALLVSMLIAFVSILPGLIRRGGRRWRYSALALLLLPFAWTAPNATATSNYLFFAFPFTVFTALAIVLLGEPASREAAA